MPLFDIAYATRPQQRLMTIEAPDILLAARRALEAAPHCDGLGQLRDNVKVTEHQAPCTVAFFADGWFRWQEDLRNAAALAH